MTASLDLSEKQIISETNAGLGLISTELLERGVDRVRMYESCPEFRQELKNFGKVFPGRVELFTKDIFQLGRFAFMDKQDNCSRVDALLKNVPKKSWVDEPVLTVVGALPNLMIIKYLIRSLALQNNPVNYGRIQLFVMIKPEYHRILVADVENNLNHYQPMTVLYKLLFDHELLEIFSRNKFLPWEKHRKHKNSPPESDLNNMYFVKINFKKQLPVPAENLLALYYFVKQFYGRGSNRIIPTIEEMMNNPAYLGSPFTAMVENDLLKSETVESDMADGMLERTITEDVEEKLNFI
ncbi:hypothetical protein JTB14_000366 [Gonioctena quinquepunctata]|nr:hypothetical protein JTB14_000366 [Gonioctena quinquepunctata]